MFSRLPSTAILTGLPAVSFPSASSLTFHAGGIRVVERHVPHRAPLGARD